MEDRKSIEWFKEDVKIDFENAETIEIENCTTETDDVPEYGSDSCTVKRIYRHSNHSLTVLESTEDDVGEYICVVNTGVEQPLKIYHSYYGPTDWTWLIILIAIIIAVLLLVICILCIICWRKRATKAGTYDVHPDEDDGGRTKKNSKVKLVPARCWLRNIIT